MTDFVLELAKNPWAQKIVAKLPVNISLPPMLVRRESAWDSQELTDRTILYLAAPKSESGSQVGLSKTISELGGEWVNDLADKKAAGIIYDLGKSTDVQDLTDLYRAIHSSIRKLSKSGRLIILWQKTGKNETLESALSALVKSIGREIGKYGSTANALVSVSEGVASATLSAVSWFLSDRSAFISGQTIHIENHLPALTAPSQQSLLAGRTAIVTGAARGIGLVIAQYFRREGAQVIGIDHPSQESVLTSEMQGIGAQVFLQDLAEPSAVDNIKHLIHTGPGQIDIMIHNAGITRDRTIANMPADDWGKVMQVNFTFPNKMTRELLKPGSAIIPLIKEGGRIVNLSSIVGLAGNVGQSNYSAAKGALIGHTKDMQHQKTSAIINTIACGFIETKMTEKIPVVMREVARRMNALKQGGLPGDVAETVLFLCSSLGSGIAGQTIRVCGLHPAGV